MSYRIKDLINPIKWLQFIQGTILSKFISFSYVEQVLYRKKTCKPCVENGNCIHCNCDVKKAFLVPKYKCSAGAFPAMMNEKDWKDYKEAYDINI